MVIYSLTKSLGFNLKETSVFHSLKLTMSKSVLVFFSWLYF